MSQDYSEKDPSTCCFRSDHSDGAASAELKLYRAFIFSVPIFFTFILLFLFYLFYLRPRRIDWSSLWMRPFAAAEDNNDISISRQSELGLKKEVREMLPIIVYKESFSVNDTQCLVCLLDYQSEDGFNRYLHVAIRFTCAALIFGLPTTAPALSAACPC